MRNYLTVFTSRRTVRSTTLPPQSKGPNATHSHERLQCKHSSSLGQLNNSIMPSPILEQCPNRLFAYRKTHRTVSLAELSIEGDSLGLSLSPPKTITLCSQAVQGYQAVLHEQCGCALSHLFLAVEELLLHQGCLCLPSFS